jgi:hypothetical protein
VPPAEARRAREEREVMEPSAQDEAIGSSCARLVHF